MLRTAKKRGSGTHAPDADEGEIAVRERIDRNRPTVRITADHAGPCSVQQELVARETHQGRRGKLSVRPAASRGVAEDCDARRGFDIFNQPSGARVYELTSLQRRHRDCVGFPGGSFGARHRLIYKVV